jgi:bacteriocin biosynthesis cyclodehydratase domain-containing protein
MTFQTAPYLICTEKGLDGLTFSHFGNISTYRAQCPDLTLAILRALKTARTLGELENSLAGFAAADIHAEIDRLNARGFLMVYESVREQEKWGRNKLLGCLAKDASTQARLSQVISESRIGVIDFGGAADHLRRTLEDAGFSRVDCLAAKTSDIDERFIHYHNFIVVVGPAELGAPYSRVNQTLLPHRKAWLLVTYDLFGGTIGPVFGARGGPCYDCVIDASRRNHGPRPQIADHIDMIDGVHADFSEMPLAKTILPYVAIETLKILSGVCRPMTIDGFYTFDAFNFRSRYDVVHPSPACPVCSRGENGSS